MIEIWLSDYLEALYNFANTIMQRHEVPYRLSCDPKMLDLE